MMWVELHAQLFQTAANAPTVFQPSGVDTIACAKDVTANNALM
jgi:hypothetical protein